MNRKRLTRRDFLKLAGAGTAVAIPAALGYGMFRSAYGEFPIENSPYVENIHTSNLDGSASILLIINKESDNPFGAYLGEILRAEGLNCFHTADLSSAQSGLLEKYDIVALAESSLNASQAEMLEGYVARGGRLVGMKPDDRLVSVFGVERSEGSISEGYIKTESRHPAGKGINPSTLQFHGSANLYRLAGAQAAAWLYHDRDTSSDHPAVSVNVFGDGVAALFSFDLAKSIAYMRQGNPEQINQDIDGLEGDRTTDLFVDWIDLDRISIPQADEQQRLFVNILALLSQGRKPLPRLWYFPEDKKSVLVMTGDSHANPVPFIEDVLSRVESYGGHMSVYYSPVIVDDLGRAMRRTRFWLTDHVPVVGNVLGGEFSSPTPLDVDEWRARGHEFALHPYVDDGLEDGWQAYWKEFTGRGYGPVPSTVRTHRILWKGWTETARLQASYGMRMNFDYYHVGPSLQNKNGEWPSGHLTGSGRPMRFIDEQGRLLNIYQQLTQFADEHLVPMGVPGCEECGWPNLSPQEGVEVLKHLLDRSVKYDDYCAIGTQFHVDPFYLGSESEEKAAAFLEGSLAYAQELGVPIWSAQEWLAFVEDRSETNFSELNWNEDAKQLTFNLPPHHRSGSKFSMMLPLYHDGASLTMLDVDGVRSSFLYRVVGGVEYACVNVDGQAHTVRASYK